MMSKKKEKAFRQEFAEKLQEDFAKHFMTSLFTNKMKFFDVSDSSEIKRIQGRMENLEDIFQEKSYISSTRFLDYCKKGKYTKKFTGFFLKSPLNFTSIKGDDGEETIEYGKANVGFVSLQIDFSTGHLKIDNKHFTPLIIVGNYISSHPLRPVVPHSHLGQAFTGYLIKAVKHISIKVMHQSIS